MRLRIFTLLLFALCGFSALTVSSPKTDKTTAFLRLVETNGKRDAQAERPALSVQEVNLLFGNEASSRGLSLQELYSAYTTSYAEAKKAKPWWKGLEPKAGWLIAITLFILLILRDIIKDEVTKVIKFMQIYLYERISGFPMFRRTALRHYRKSISERYSQFRVPFRKDRPLSVREVYVSVSLRGDSSTKAIDALQLIARTKRLMITGSPGSGKSMLLRYLALCYADRKLPEISPGVIPILLELNRLNVSGKILEEHLADTLQSNDFPNAKSFIKSKLVKGNILLLFDGLDEVNSTQREATVQMIKDFLTGPAEHCPAVFTCRTAVYRNDFSEISDLTVEIQEFSDKQIQKFLAAWRRYLPPEKSIAQLLRTLRERPRIMALARNPLLLTIIAFLYTDVEFVLPHSRSEFYDQAVDILLRQWKGEGNRHKAAHKRLILEHLALFNQDLGVKGDQDRRSIELPLVLQKISEILPSLNLEQKEAEPILDEIVERSGLLLAIDGGSKFQFAHLTLQEFFAAKALQSRPNDLLQRFEADADAWREPVKLWCGLDHDSTEVIQAISAQSAIVSFECLADAQKIDAVIADQIIDSFSNNFGTHATHQDAILAAFAAVAAGPTLRGQRVFSFLVASLGSSEKVIQIAAATALSLTNQPGAAEAIGRCYKNLPEEAQKVLARLGDLAVPILFRISREGNVDALKDLTTIGTEDAIHALADLISLSEERFATEAAWQIASLLAERPNTVEILQTCKLPSSETSQWSWIWEPFKSNSDNSLKAIMGKVVALMDRSLDWKRSPPTTTADPRLIIPLIIASEELPAPQKQQLGELAAGFSSFFLRRAYDADSIPADAGSIPADISSALTQTTAGQRIHTLLTFLPKELVARLVTALFLTSKSWPSARDWINLGKPRVTFRWSIEHIAILCIIIGISAIALISFIVRIITGPPMILMDWILSATALASVIGSWCTIVVEELDDELLVVVFGVIVVPFVLMKDWEQKPSDYKEVLEVVAALLYLPSIIYLSIFGMARYLSDKNRVLFWLAISTTLVLFQLYYIARKRTRGGNTSFNDVIERYCEEMHWLDNIEGEMQN